MNKRMKREGKKLTKSYTFNKLVHIRKKKEFWRMLITHTF